MKASNKSFTLKIISNILLQFKVHTVGLAKHFSIVMQYTFPEVQLPVHCQIYYMTLDKNGGYFWQELLEQ